MTASSLITLRQSPQSAIECHAPAHREFRPANDWVLSTTGPERDLVISFDGLSPEAQRRALNSFPGARRYVLVAD